MLLPFMVIPRKIIRIRSVINDDIVTSALLNYFPYLYPIKPQTLRYLHRRRINQSSSVPAEPKLVLPSSLAEFLTSLPRPLTVGHGQGEIAFYLAFRSINQG